MYRSTGMRGFLATILLLLLLPHAAPAEAHHGLWMRTSVRLARGTHFSAEAELQHRMQNGYGGTSRLPDHNLLHAFRTRLYYHVNKYMHFSLVPLSAFSHYPVIRVPADESAAPGPELRFSVAADFRYHTGNGFILSFRNETEYRAFMEKRAHLRLRSRIGLQREWTPVWSTGIHRELFFISQGGSPATGTEQARTVFSLRYRPEQAWELELAYMYLSRYGLHGTAGWHAHNLLLSFTFNGCRR